MIQKSYEKNMNGNLYLIPTPIGNMDDITIRSINTLKEVDIIYAEDTRVTKILLNKYNISKRLFSCHKYSEEKNKDKIINELKNGLNIAIVTDRGTPLISDPGSVIVSGAINSGINVVSLPGASALLPALNMSGISNEKFLFYGFLNSKNNKMVAELQRIQNTPYTIIFYESPHRLKKTLQVILEVFGERKIAVAREISKLYEEIFRGSIKEAIEFYEDVKGEIVIIVEGSSNDNEEVDYEKLIDNLVKNKGYKVSSAIKEVADMYCISKNKLYNIYRKE